MLRRNEMEDQSFFLLRRFWHRLDYSICYFRFAYLLGLPILGYSLDNGKEHVILIVEKLEKLIYSGQLDAKELDRLAGIAMAGLAAEGLRYDKVVGQSADLFTLQRLINRSKPQIIKEQQQNLSRWAVGTAFELCLGILSFSVGGKLSKTDSVTRYQFLCSLSSQ